MFSKSSILSLSFLSLLSIGCSAVDTTRMGEFAGLGIQSPGQTDTSNMSRGEMHAAIQRAHLDGELTAEQARKAHMQLDVKGHLTREQIMVIRRDRLAKRDAYETKKENLDVVKDVFGTGTDVTGNINSTIDNIKAIFN